MLVHYLAVDHSGVPGNHVGQWPELRADPSQGEAGHGEDDAEARQDQALHVQDERQGRAAAVLRGRRGPHGGRGKLRRVADHLPAGHLEPVVPPAASGVPTAPGQYSRGPESESHVRRRQGVGEFQRSSRAPAGPRSPTAACPCGRTAHIAAASRSGRATHSVAEVHRLGALRGRRRRPVARRGRRSAPVDGVPAGEERQDEPPRPPADRADPASGA